jgi:PAS domain S-box-containing protein
MKLKQLFIFLLIINLMALMSVVFILSAYQDAIKRLENAYVMQHQSLILADELRQSSDDLTRMARTYVLTANERFKEQFHRVLDIRNGVKARPKNYNRIYWDFYTIDNPKEIQKGQKVPLKVLMKEAGFPDEELALLYKSQEQSDELTHLETKAMNAMIGIFEDNKGEYTRYGEPNFAMAREIMHSDEYHKAKISIMEPLNEFYKAFETRTQMRVIQAHKTVKEQEMYLSIAVLFLILLFLVTFFSIILLRIIRPLESLNKSMLKLAQNKMNITLPHKAYTDEVGEMIQSVEVFKNNAIKLIASQEQNKRLLDLAGEGIFGLDAKGRFTFVNPKASSLLNFDTKELIGQYIHHTITQHFDHSNSQQKERLMLSKTENQSFQCKQGSVFPIDYISTPIYNTQSLLEGSVVVFTDVTQRKKEENRLKAAIDQAQKANQAKSIFLTNMSHELRTPLNAILGFSTLLHSSLNLTVTEKENLKTIHNSGKHLLNIINEILEFAKIEAGKIHIKNTTFDLFCLLDDIQAMFVSRCEIKNIEFNLIIDSGVPQYIQCDELRLKQVLINLLGNALKFTQKGEIKLNVTHKKNSLFIEVMDTGIGMNKEALSFIFKPFEQFETNTHSHKGTGLGLSITKELIQKMGGTIHVNSKKNQGTTFYMNILANPVLKQTTKPLCSKNAGATTLLEKPAHVLIADDIDINRKLLVQFLQKYEITCHEATHGKEVLALLEQHTFDLIFMDILMPKMDGITTIKHIRHQNNAIPIIAISANVFEEDKHHALNSGANGFIGKPFTQEDIQHVLHEFLSFKPKSTYNTGINHKLLDMETTNALILAAKQFDAQKALHIIEKSSLSTHEKTRLYDYIHTFQFERILCLFKN